MESKISELVSTIRGINATITESGVLEMVDHALRTLLIKEETSYVGLVFSFSTPREYDPRMQKSVWVAVIAHLMYTNLVEVTSYEMTSWDTDVFKVGNSQIVFDSSNTKFRMNPKYRLHIESKLNYGI
jgi:hypothetical protein